MVQTKNFGPMLAWFESGGKVNQTTLIILYKAALKNPPAMGATAVRFNIALARWIKRTTMDEVCPKETMIMKKHFDNTFDKSLLNGAS